MIINLGTDTLEYRKEKLAELDRNTIKIGVPVIDRAFGSLVRGGLYAFCAGTAVGKTTLLLATAKALAANGNKVLYITTEMSLVQLCRWLPDIEPNLYIGTSDELTRIDNDYDVICYDYLGAEPRPQDGNKSEWQALRDEAHDLADLAIRTNCIIFTGLQANHEINKLDKDLLRTPHYVAFGKSIINKVSGAAYIVREGTALNLYVMKNRFNQCNTEVIDLNYYLDYATKSWLNRSY